MLLLKHFTVDRLEAREHVLVLLEWTFHILELALKLEITNLLRFIL